jgi:hypothetical protein
MLGILLSNPSKEQIEKISALGDANIDYCVFSSRVLPEDTKQIPQLQPLRAYSFGGTLIATDIRTAEFSRVLAAPKRKFFYITSMEWTQASDLMYDSLKRIYLNDDMDLLVSNSKDYEIISNLFKKPTRIIEDWDFRELLNEH